MRLWLTLIALFTLGACSTVGSETVTDAGRLDRLQAGVSDRADAHSLLGQPHDVRITAEVTRWLYYSGRGSMDPMTLVPVVGLVRNGSNFDITTTALRFDTEGRFIAYSQSRDAFYYSTWSGYRDMYDGDTYRDRVRLEMDAIGVTFDRRAADRIRPIVEMMDAQTRR